MAATEVPITIKMAASQTARAFDVTNSSDTSYFGITANGNPILRQFTTKPTTGLSKGELYYLLHGSRPMLAMCYTTATSAAKLIRLRTKTNGRLTA